MPNTIVAAVDQMRAVAAMLAEHPPPVVPNVSVRMYGPPKIHFYCGDDRAEFDACVRWAKEHFGAGKKDAASDLFKVSFSTSGGWLVEVFASREQVCERVLVGTETAEVPDPDAPTITVERPVFEWRCGSILSDAERRDAERRADEDERSLAQSEREMAGA